MPRPKKPLKQQTGNLTKEYKQRRQIEEDMIKQSTDLLLTPPDWLIDQVAIDEWERIVKELTNNEMFGNLDIDNLGGFCNAFSQYKKATEQLKKLGLIVKDKSGKPIENPYINTQRKYAQEMREFGKLCGLTIDSRLKFASQKLAKIETDIFDEFGDI